MMSLKKIRSSWLLPFLSGNLLMLALVAMCISIGSGIRSEQASHPRHRVQSLDTTAGTPGPWGRIESSRLLLADTERIESLYDRFMVQPKWEFPDVTRGQLARYLLSLELPFRQRQKLLNPEVWKQTETGIQITPPESVVFALDNDSRTHIYNVLARDQSNDPQARPIILPKATLDEELSAIGLNASQIKAVRQLAFMRGDLLCLADFGVAEKVLGQRAFANFVEYVFAVPAAKARLKVTPNSDITALAGYWGRGGREAQITPLLKSLARVPGGGDINISYLLPEFARQRLYRYPDETPHENAGGQPDCFYSSMNFFNAKPDAAFFDPAHVSEVLDRDYEVVPKPALLGDIIMLINEKGRYMHACVFVADNLVFTKNGVTALQPWTLMQMDDMVGLYYKNKSSAKVHVLRKKVNSQEANRFPGTTSAG